MLSTGEASPRTVEYPLHHCCVSSNVAGEKAAQHRPNDAPGAYLLGTTVDGLWENDSRAGNIRK
jgi:hypothetical protein